MMTHRALARIALAPLATALAFALAGCGGDVSTTPPGPISPTISTAPSGTGAPDTAHAGAKVVSPQVRSAVVASLKANGITVADPAKVDMTYSADRQQVIVAGAGMTQAQTKAQQPRVVQSVTLEQGSGKWRVLNVAGEK